MKKLIGLMVLVLIFSIGTSFGSTIPNDAKIEKTFVEKGVPAVDVVMLMDAEVSKIVAVDFRSIDVLESNEYCSFENEPITMYDLNSNKEFNYQYRRTNDNIFNLYYKTINKILRLRERPSWTAIL